MKTKYISAGLLLIVATFGIAMIFWQQEIQYTLPTPVPANYQPVSSASLLSIPGLPFNTGKKPVFLHFFNPDCPCSRFNLKELKTLIKDHGNEAQFVVVFQTKNQDKTAEELSRKFDLNVPAVIDWDKKIATTCGVYSTPQAVIVDKNSQLYFRGNYNKARYCTAPNTAFAQLALKALLSNRPVPSLSELATKAYGCELPQATSVYSVMANL